MKQPIPQTSEAREEVLAKVSVKIMLDTQELISEVRIQLTGNKNNLKIR